MHSRPSCTDAMQRCKVVSLPANFGAGWYGVYGSRTVARLVLGTSDVQRDDREAGVQHEGVTEVERKRLAGSHAAAEELVQRLFSTDPTDLAHIRAVPASRLKNGEQRLALGLLVDALNDAQRPGDTLRRREARAWLRNAGAMLSSQVCFEALGINYDAAIDALERQWATGTAKRVGRSHV